MLRHAIIHTDGGARGNPGPAGVGVVIGFQGKKYHYKKFIGEATNNQAEYQAVIFALENAKELGIKTIDFFLDSELICNQLRRVYKIKDAELGKLFVRAWNLLQNFQRVTFKHISRNDNSEADVLVNQAIDEKK